MVSGCSEEDGQAAGVRKAKIALLIIALAITIL